MESGGQTFNVEAEQIILSAGAVGSPHLLLLSGVGPAVQLGGVGVPVVHDLPGVGRNLKDHPKVYVTWEVGDGFDAVSNRGAGGAALRLTAPGSHLRNDLGISLSGPAVPRVKATGASDVASAARAEGGGNVRHLEMMVALLLPESQGELTLTSSDHRVQPAMRYNYLAEPFDRERLRAGIRLALELAARHELAPMLGRRIEPEDSDLIDDALDQWLMREVTTYSHISCTCRMGPSDDPLAVVDQYGKVHGIDGLRIVDASIMPDLVRAPINPAVIMVAERVADFIRAGQ